MSTYQDFQIAYLILAHRNPKQLFRLVERLDSPEVAFFIHVDGKSDLRPFLAIEERKKNVRILKNRVDVFWGGYSVVKATLYLIRRATKYQFKYGILMSGQEYPIKNNSEIYRFFSESELEYIDFCKIADRPEWWPRLNYYHYLDSYLTNPRIGIEMAKSTGLKFPGFLSLAYKRALESSVLRTFLPERSPVAGLTPYGGSQWWMLSRSCLNYIADYVEKHQELQTFFKFTAIPDEMFFQTILLNSPFANKVVNYEKYREWSANRSYEEEELDSTTFHYRFIRPTKNEGVSRGIATLDENDFEALRSSRALFARKLAPHKSKGLMKLIDHHLLS